MEGPFPSVSSSLSVAVLLLVVVAPAPSTAAGTTHVSKAAFGPRYGLKDLNRTSFPPNFLFGAASSSYQYEGAAFEDGKGPSIWDYYTRKYPNRVEDRSNGDVAEDFYHRYKDDVKLMKKMGLDVFRFSISWPRIIPQGKISKGVNQKGIDFYNNLINELLKNDIQPFVTLFHWDLPQALDDAYGGFLSNEIVGDYRDYVDLCFEKFGDRVKNWITLNEPWIYAAGGYVMARLAPFRCSDPMLNCTVGDDATEPYIVGHNLLLAHSAAVELYRQKYQKSQKGKIGITFTTFWMVPYDETREHHRRAASRSLDYMFGWFADPVGLGDYPYTMRALVGGNRLPKFTEEEKKKLKGSYDFIGVNYYTARFARYQPLDPKAKPSFVSDSYAKLSQTRDDGTPVGPTTCSPFNNVYPEGFYGLLMHVKNRYNNPVVYITENGIDDSANVTLRESLMDQDRIDYLHKHLAFLELAIKDGADVRGYFAWSFLDNFEWSSGYKVRMGLYYVDYKDKLKRIPKLSAEWFTNFLMKN